MIKYYSILLVILITTLSVGNGDLIECQFGSKHDFISQPLSEIVNCQFSSNESY